MQVHAAVSFVFAGQSFAWGQTPSSYASWNIPQAWHQAMTPPMHRWMEAASVLLPQTSVGDAKDIVAVSVALSAFIDNIPYVATMLPVVGTISGMLGIEPYLLAFGLLIGATLGGNITPIGASANIAGIGILQKEGYTVATKDFLRIGIPFTLIAAVSGALVIWLAWA